MKDFSKKALKLLLVVTLMIAGTSYFAFGGKEEKEAATIKVGGLAPLTGYMASDGNDMAKGLKMAVKEINDQGGLLGRKLELILYDTEELLSETFAAAAEKLIMRDKVDVLIAGYSGEAGPDTFGKYDVPYLYNEGSLACVEIHRANAEEYWNVFMTCDHSLNFGRFAFDMVQAMADRAGYKFPNKKLAIVWGGWNWDKMYAEGFGKRAEEKGWEVVYNTETTVETTEWGGVLVNIRASNPSIIFFGVWGSGAPATFLRQFKENPIDALIVYNQCTVNPEFLNILGEEADGPIDQSYHGVLPTPAGKAWLERYKEMFGEEHTGLMDVVTYDELMMWAAAVKRVGKADDYRAVAKAIQENPYKGIAGTYRFNEDRYAPVTPDLPMFAYQYQGGKRVLIGLISQEPVFVEGTKFQIPSWIKGR